MFTDLRNAIILLAILEGCLAQFYFKFPDDYYYILACIIGYGFFTLCAHAVEYFGMSGNTHIIVMNKEGAKDDRQIRYSVGIKSDLKQYSHEWNLTFTSRISPSHNYKCTVDIRQIFDVNGEFVKRNFDKAISKEWAQCLSTFSDKSD